MGGRWQFYVVIIFIFFTYIIIQSRIVLFPPPLTINVPSTVRVNIGHELLLKGATHPLSRVYINGEPIFIDRQGKFSQKFLVRKGVNEVILSAKSRFGKERVKMIVTIGI